MKLYRVGGCPIIYGGRGWFRLPVLEHVLKPMLRNLPGGPVLEHVPWHLSRHVLKRMVHVILMTVQYLMQHVVSHDLDTAHYQLARRPE